MIKTSTDEAFEVKKNALVNYVSDIFSTSNVLNACVFYSLPDSWTDHRVRCKGWLTCITRTMTVNKWAKGRSTTSVTRSRASLTCIASKALSLSSLPLWIRQTHHPNSKSSSPGKLTQILKWCTIGWLMAHRWSLLCHSLRSCKRASCSKWLDKHPRTHLKKKMSKWMRRLGVLLMIYWTREKRAWTAQQ